MRHAIPYFALPLALVLGCAPKAERVAAAPGAPGVGAAPGDLAAQSDEFDNPEASRTWRRVYKEERWGADQLEKFDMGRAKPGWMMMMPFTSTWYRDYRGELTFKPVQGDFVMTTRVRVTGRSGRGAPRAQFSLAGLMVRVPRRITPQTWSPGGENYVFLSLGAADPPGEYKFEVKTTINSDSQLRTSPAANGETELQIARIGSSLILLNNQGGGWGVFQRYSRPDFPPELQAGLTCYTDYPSASQLGAQQHNGTAIRSGNPDLLAFFDYVRYRRPNVPSGLAGKSLADPRSVSDGELLRFLGAAAAR